MMARMRCWLSPGYSHNNIGYLPTVCAHPSMRRRKCYYSCPACFSPAINLVIIMSPSSSSSQYDIAAKLPWKSDTWYNTRTRSNFVCHSIISHQSTGPEHRTVSRVCSMAPRRHTLWMMVLPLPIMMISTRSAHLTYDQLPAIILLYRIVVFLYVVERRKRCCPLVVKNDRTNREYYV